MELKEKLTKEIEKATWDMLRVNDKQGLVYMVHKDLDLVTVALAMAQDHVQEIKNWLEKGFLKKPSQKQITNWEKAPHQKLGSFLIIQPYVLLKSD